MISKTRLINSSQLNKKNMMQNIHSNPNSPHKNLSFNGALNTGISAGFKTNVKSALIKLGFAVVPGGVVIAGFLYALKATASSTAVYRFLKKSESFRIATNDANTVVKKTSKFLEKSKPVVINTAQKTFNFLKQIVKNF